MFDSTSRTRHSRYSILVAENTPIAPSRPTWSDRLSSMLDETLEPMSGAFAGYMSEGLPYWKLKL